MFGETPTGLRVASALALAVCALLAALIAREMGGGRRAQVPASASVGPSTMLFIGHLLSTTTFDLLAWSVLLWLLVKLLGAVIFASNYDEAGALRRFGPARGLPQAYAGHNSFRSFGRPAGSAGPVILVGFEEPGFAARHFRGCRPAGRFDNGLDIDNEEQRAPFAVCDARAARGPRRGPNCTTSTRSGSRSRSSAGEVERQR